jgi:hypothetical protein
MVAVVYPPESPITFSGYCIAAEPAMDTYGGRCLKVPLSGVMWLECLVRKYSGRTYFDKIAAELVFECPIFAAAVVGNIAGPHHIKVPSAREVTVKAHAAVALYAPVHLMVYKRPEILVVKSTLLPAVFTVVMTGHDSHVLKVALARKSVTSGSSIEILVPSAAGVMQDITIVPSVSFSSLKIFTAH